MMRIKRFSRFALLGNCQINDALVCEVAMKATNDEKLAGIRKESLPAFDLAAFVFLLLIAGGAALWAILIAAMPP